ncbi:hypothetical protein Patl1_26604 [Pistacia atlantica]|uniref:Uncharacterized protein n=1 Tax=Pistacia atlantica TaxID=434234 RepID=A0ACC1B3H9_9ROSI|nr:hypothetical protein Patl1_26604 [Pistacia atlantica]
MFDIEARGAVSTAVNSSPPSKTVNSEEESSDTEYGFSSFPAGSQTPPRDNDGKKETPSKNDNNNGVNKTPPNGDHKGKDELEKAIMLGGQIISIAAAVWAKNSDIKMSSEAKCLWYFLLACVVLSLVSFFYSLFLSGYERLRKVAWVVRAIGIVATALALVTAIGLHLPNELMIWGTFGVCALSALAIICFALTY